MPIQPAVVELVFNRYTYLKKLLEEANTQEDTKKLFQFCCWENPTFSHAILYELLWQIGTAYTYELRPYIDLLLAVLLLEDSWQTFRIQKAIRGIPDDHSARDGLFDIISRSKNHYQKRGYQCIKLLVTLFGTCVAAKALLDKYSDIRRKWAWSVEWLSDELDRGRGPYSGPTSATASGSYSYNNSYNSWSPPAQSNETANGYYLERSPSARLTLEKACKLLPEEETEDPGEEMEVGTEVSGDPSNSPSPSNKPAVVVAASTDAPSPTMKKSDKEM